MQYTAHENNKSLTIDVDEQRKRYVIEETGDFPSDFVAPCSREYAQLFAGLLNCGFSRGELLVNLPNHRNYYCARTETKTIIAPIRREQLHLIPKTAHLVFIGQPSKYLFKMFPNSKSYVLTLGDYLIPYGYIAYQVMNQYAWIKSLSLRKYMPLVTQHPDTKPYEKFDTDASGKMAQQIASGLPVVNKIYQTKFFESSFFSRTLSLKIPSGKVQNGLYLTTFDAFNELYPNTPLSQLYAMQYAPVNIKPNDEFFLTCGLDGGKIYMQLLPSWATDIEQAFFQFLSIVSGKRVVYSCNMNEADLDKKAVFYHNGFYIETSSPNPSQ